MGNASPNNSLILSSYGTFSSKTFSYYINGVQSSNVDISNSRWNHISFNIQEGITGNLNWGHLYPPYENTTSMYIDAYIDEVNFFSDKLTQQEITDLSNNIQSNNLGDDAGLYKGTEITQGYSGEWIQVNMGSSTNTKVNSFTIKPQQNTNSDIIDSNPKEFKMFASNDTSS